MAEQNFTTVPKRLGNFRHGYFGTPTYKAWDAMIQRCTNPRCAEYARYGGQGVTVCAEWKTCFTNFLRDVGPRPAAQLSLDRFPDKDGNYEPGNVRWATPKEQANNRRPRKRHFRVTHCNRGHEYTPENTHVQKRGEKIGRRSCITCRRARKQERVSS